MLLLLLFTLLRKPFDRVLAFMRRKFLASVSFKNWPCSLHSIGQKNRPVADAVPGCRLWVTDRIVTSRYMVKLWKLVILTYNATIASSVRTVIYLSWSFVFVQYRPRLSSDCNKYPTSRVSWCSSPDILWYRLANRLELACILFVTREVALTIYSPSGTVFL